MFNPEPIIEVIKTMFHEAMDGTITSNGLEQVKVAFDVLREVSNEPSKELTCQLCGIDKTFNVDDLFLFTGSKNDVILSTELNQFYNLHRPHINITLNNLKQLLKLKGAVCNGHFTNDRVITRTGTRKGYYGVKSLF